MTPWRHHLRRARFAVTTLVAVVLIGAAVAMGLLQLLLPMATHYPDFVANELSARLHRPVKFAAISSTWKPSGPLLTVQGLTLGPGKPGGHAVTLPRATLQFHFGAWLHPGHRWLTLRISGVELRVVHTTAGWRVDGFARKEGQAHVSLQSLPVNLDLRDLRVDIVDTVSGHAWRLYAPRLRMVNVGGVERFGGFIRQRGTHQSVTVRGRMDAESRDYTLYLATNSLDLATATRGVNLHGYTVHAGQADIALWGRWRDGKLASARVRYALTHVDVSGPDDRAAALSSLAGVFRAARVAGGWNLAWRGPGKPQADIDAVGGAIAHLRGHPGAWRVSAAARAVAVAPLLKLLSLVPAAPPSLADWVRHAGPQAHVDSAALQWRQGGRYALMARLSDIKAAASGRMPGLDLRQAVVRADNNALSVELPPQPATLALTDVFRQPLVLRKLAGTLVAWRTNGLWNVGVDSLHLDMDTFSADLDAHLAWHGKGLPFVSAYASVRQGQVTDAKRFLPYRHMSPHLLRWLDHALVAGKVTSARVLLRGPLAAWPFADHQGRFEATGHVKDATFDFSPKWPPATGVDAVADFIDNRMYIDASDVQVRDVSVDHATATIPDFHAGALNLAVSGASPLPALLDFVRHSPVGAHAIKALTGLKADGVGKFGVHLSIPLHDASQFALHGKVALDNADVTAEKWNLALQDITGTLLIDGKGFVANHLSTVFRGSPASLSLAVGSGVSDPEDIVEASLDTTASAQTLVQGYPKLAGLVAHASGAAPFHVGVNVKSGSGDAPATPVLNVRSSLVGIALDLPAPLGKPADKPLPLRLTLQLPPAGAPLSVSLGSVLQVRGRLAGPAHGRPAALAVAFGPTPPANVPDRGLVASGHASKLDLSGWVQIATVGAANAGFPMLTAAHVSTDDAEVFGTSLGAMKLDFVAGAKTDHVHFDGTVVAGDVQLPTSHLMTRGITAHLAHLYWPEPAAPKRPATPQPPPLKSPIAPTAIPPLHVTIGDLRLGNAHLGATTFESSPTFAGMHVAKFDSRGEDFSIHAHGDWNGTTAASHSHFVTGITSQDFGKTLAALGFKGLLAGGHNTHIHIDGTWPGTPASFSLRWMNGSLDIRMGKGRILAVQPGLGRLLGLLSVREIPSRLALHFGDVFKSGFGFDQATASFRFRKGSAYTKDMLIKAPAARISMRGRVGFRRRNFDLTVTVVPHLGATLPIVGAVIGGPVGAAAGLVVQGLLGKGINKVAGSIYHVTGSWKKPKIVTVAAPPAPTADMVPAVTKPLQGLPVFSRPSPGTALPGLAVTVLPPPASRVRPALPVSSSGSG